MPKKVPTLEYLVNQCCEANYNKCVNKEFVVEDRKYYSNKSFKKFISDTHCQENLNFLIEIYHYEQLWNQLFERHSSILKCSEERRQSTASIFLRKDSIREPSIKSMKYMKSLRNSSNDSLSTRRNLNINDLKLPNVIQTQDDFDTISFANLNIESSNSTNNNNSNNNNSNRNNNNHEVWDTLFKSSYCDNNSHEQTADSISEINEAEDIKKELTDKFNDIIEEYVLSNSIYEINLPSDVYLNLTKEFKDTSVLFHSPATLLPAKNAVLQLLRENIYYKFVSEQEQLIKNDELKEKEKELLKEKEAKSKELAKLESSRMRREVKKTKSKSNLKINTEEHRHHPERTNSSPLTTVRSNDTSRPSTPQTNSLSSFLTKYHLKLHNGGSTSSLADEKDTESASNNTSLNNINETNEINDQYFNNDQMHHHHDSIRYIKGPCNIEPTAASYNPRPPLKTSKGSSSWSRNLLKFKMKKKESTSSMASVNSTISTNSTNSRNSRNSAIDSSTTSPSEY